MRATMIALSTLSLFVSIIEAVQPSAPSPIAAPLRELPWAQLNFLHTTDTHGWHAGHLSEASFSADWGDYISFAEHLRNRADAEGVDLLLVDTGDRIEGNGLYDASEPKGIYTYDIFKEQDIDIITSGNHELYRQNASEGEFYKTVPNFKNNYIASNLDIYSPKTGKLEPLAPRFKKFTTKNQGIRILAFGFLFDFTGNANNTVVIPVEKTITEDWFQEAIRDRDVDLFVVAGHVAARSEEYEMIFKAIRAVQWDTPIQFFAGHRHIRDYQIYDSKATSLASGRYMETIGFMSIDGLNQGGKKDTIVETDTKKSLKFSRRYIDNNLYSLMHHSNTNSTTFPSPKGSNLSEAIHTARKALKLDRRHGCAPKDYWVNRVPYPNDDSLFSLLTDHILPTQIREPSRKDIPALILTNTGGMRFDIFKGPYTRDTDYQVMPFTGGFRFFKDMPYKAARKVLGLLNSEGPVLQLVKEKHSLDSWMLAPSEQLGRQMQAAKLEARMGSSFESSALEHGQIPLMQENNNGTIFPGYTTRDDAGNDGDDTIHSKIDFYDVPNCVQASVNFQSSHSMEDTRDPEKVDLIYNEFLEPWILLALQYLGEKVSEDDVAPYMEGTSFTDIIPKWVENNWNDCSEWDSAFTRKE